MRRIPLTGFGDPEAVEYVGPGSFVITDEREQRLVKVRIDDATRVIDAADFQQLSLGIGRNGNKGFEGLAYDAKNQRLLVAKERDPVRIFEVLGFPHVDESKPLALQVNTDPKRDARLFVRDLSSLDFTQFKPVSWETAPKAARINMRLPEALMAALKAKAAKRGIPYQRLIREALEKDLAKP